MNQCNFCVDGVMQQTKYTSLGDTTANRSTGYILRQ